MPGLVTSSFRLLTGTYAIAIYPSQLASILRKLVSCPSLDFDTHCRLSFVVPYSWAHGALSSFADRIKIARLGAGDEINLSIQFILSE
jgi:hypothetical protein